LLATGSLPVTLVGVSVSEAKNGVVEIDYGTEFSDLKQAMTVTADYSDGSQLELSSEDYTLVCEGYKSNGGTFSAVISYLGEDLSVTLDVAEVEGLSVDNEKITVSYGTTLSDIKEKITVYKTFTHGDPVKLVGEDFQLICSEYKATVPGTYWAYLYDKNGDYEYCITIEVKSS
jgi:hypothetical protein